MSSTAASKQNKYSVFQLFHRSIGIVSVNPVFQLEYKHYIRLKCVAYCFG